MHSKINIIEVNPRSSRTIPFISKVTGIPMIEIATTVMTGKKLTDLPYGMDLAPNKDLYAVKAPVFSMSKLAGVDTFLGPEMKSTGEVMGIDKNIDSAIMKALIASGLTVKPGISVLISLADIDKEDSIPLIKDLDRSGHKIFSTSEGFPHDKNTLSPISAEVIFIISFNDCSEKNLPTGPLPEMLLLFSKVK